MPSYGRDKRTGSWFVRWSETDPLTGKRSQPSKRPFRTRADAVDWHHRNIAGRRASATASTPLLDYLDRWLDIHGAGLSDSSRRIYRQATNAASAHLGAVRLRDLEASHIRDWHAAMLRRGYAPDTIRTYHSVLAIALNQAVDDGILYRAATHRAGPRLGKERGKRPHWSPDEIEYFLAATDLHIPEPDWKALPYRIMALSAIRPGECLALGWSAVNTERGTLSVPDAKTPAGVRTFAIPSDLVADLRLWRPAQIEQRLAAPSWEDNDLVITSPVRPGGKLSASALIQRLRRYCEALDLPAITPHGLRHSWTSWMAVLGVHPSIVQQVLGHANVSETLNTYTHASEAMSRQAAAAVESALAHPQAGTRRAASVHPKRIR